MPLPGTPDLGLSVVPYMYVLLWNRQLEIFDTLLCYAFSTCLSNPQVRGDHSATNVYKLLY